MIWRLAMTVSGVPHWPLYLVTAVIGMANQARHFTNGVRGMHKAGLWRTRHGGVGQG